MRIKNVRERIQRKIESREPLTLRKFHEMINLRDQLLSTSSDLVTQERARNFRMNFTARQIWKRNDPVWRIPDTGSAQEAKQEARHFKHLVRKDIAFSSDNPMGEESRIVRLIDDREITLPRPPFKPINSPIHRRKPFYRKYSKETIDFLLD